MNILELAILKKMVGGGGGSGTDNYNDLSNLPQINGETLAGNKTAENLGLQDALTFDSAPTKDSTNPVESNGVYNALAGKQDNLTFDGVYSASTNKVATESTVTNAIDELDVSETSFDANETIDVISETDGKITITKKDIAIASNQVTSMTGYTKPSSAPATPAIQTSDTANQAFGKLEFKADTNQTNILYVSNKTGKNLLKLDSFASPSGITYTVNADNSITINKPAAISNNEWRAIGTVTLKAGTYVLSGVGATGLDASRFKLSDDHGWNQWNDTYTQAVKTVTEETTVTIYINILAATTLNNVTIYPMVCTQEDWNIGHDYTMYALPNSDLTYLEAEDRAALAEVVDSGAKQLIPYNLSILKSNNTLGKWANNVYTYNSVTFTVNSDDSISVNRSAIGTSGVSFRLATNAAFSPGIYVLSAGSGTLPQDWTLSIDWSDNTHTYATSGTNPITFTLTAAKTGNIYIWVSTPSGSFTYKPMICTKAAFGVSSKFVPYRVPINGVFWAEKYEARSTTLVSTGIKFTASKQTIYRITATAQYGNSKPTQLVIKKKLIPSESEGNFVAVSSDTNSQSLTATGIMTLGVGGYFEVYAAYDGTTSNRVYAIVEEVVL